MTSHHLPSGKYPIETHFAVLRRFMSVSRNGAEPVEPAKVDDQGVPPGSAQSNAGFLSDLGLLIEEKPGQFKPTPVAMQLVNTQLADEQRGRRLLRSLVEKTWFGVATRNFLRGHEGRPMREDELAAALASASLPTSDSDEGAIRLLVDYLVYTGIVVLPERSLPKATTSPNTTEATAVDAAPKPSRRRANRPAPASGGPPAPSTDDSAPWEVIETSEFSLKIRPKAAAVKRLRKQLDLLDEKLADGA